MNEAAATLARPEATDWYVRLPPRRPAPVQLVAIPGAGTGCGVMAPLARRVSGRLDLLAANLPGRLARHSEPARTEFQPLITELADALPDALDETRPYALFGYCSGALLAYGVLCELRRRSARLPVRLVAVSYVPPHRVAYQPDPTGLPSDEFWSGIMSYGGVPEALADEQHRPVFEAALRADHAVIADYIHMDDDVAEGAAVPVTMMAGTRDQLLDARVALGWSQYAGDDFTLKLVGGGHWLLDEALDPVAEHLVRELVPTA
jgi:surfactin synthase thioesterase subunit